MVLPKKEFIEELKVEWKRLWSERHDDKIRAEGIALSDYRSLFIDKGTVIHATRDFKALNFKEILQQHQVTNAELYIPPSPQVGGWGKFVKENMAVNNQKSKKAKNCVGLKSKNLPKKSGRGWLHK